MYLLTTNRKTYYSLSVFFLFFFLFIRLSVSSYLCRSQIPLGPSFCLYVLLLKTLPYSFFFFIWYRFMVSGLKSDFNKLRMKLSEIATSQLADLNRKSRQLQRAITRDLRMEDSIYVSEVDAPNFTDFFYPLRTDCFSTRQPYNPIEVVNLDWHSKYRKYAGESHFTNCFIGAERASSFSQWHECRENTIHISLQNGILELWM